MGKTLVVYFTWSGKTKKMAEKIAEIKNADVVEIKTVKVYPTQYNQLLEISRAEKSHDERPELQALNIDIDGYETIIIGYPNWHSSCPKAILSFLEKFDLSGKVLAPFCTHGGGGIGNSESDIKKSCPKAVLKKGYAKGSSDTKAITKWLETL
ncbi:flavodoxin [Eubacteriaceae bacterium ES3]|nr:flavodoxin [Eubacteriaceae bacterium ES3]